MRAYTFTTCVDRPPDEVWRFLTDLSQAPRWRTAFKSMTLVGDGPLGPGSAIRVVMEVHGQVKEREVRTIAFEPPHRWTTRSGSEGMEGDFTYALAPEGAGTRVTATCDLRAKGLLAWLFLPLVARGERRARHDQLARFKAACEGSRA